MQAGAAAAATAPIAGRALSAAPGVFFVAFSFNTWGSRAPAGRQDAGQDAANHLAREGARFQRGLPPHGGISCNGWRGPRNQGARGAVGRSCRACRSPEARAATSNGARSPAPSLLPSLGGPLKRLNTRAPPPRAFASAAAPRRGPAVLGARARRGRLAAGALPLAPRGPLQVGQLRAVLPGGCVGARAGEACVRVRVWRDPQAPSASPAIAGVMRGTTGASEPA